MSCAMLWGETWLGAGAWAVWLDQGCPRWVSDVLLSLLCLCLQLHWCWVWGAPWERLCLPRLFWGGGEWAAKRGGAFLSLQSNSVAEAGVTSTLGQGTQQCVTGVAYHLGGDIGTKYKVL